MHVWTGDEGQRTLILHHFLFLGRGGVDGQGFVAPLVRSWISSFALLCCLRSARRPSRPARPPCCRRGGTLRIETLDSSVSSLIRATSLRRTSVHNGGTVIRRIRPSFCGLNPSPLA